MAGGDLFGPGAHACNGTIVEPFYNFDNVAKGMISVFIMCTYVRHATTVWQQQQEARSLARSLAGPARCLCHRRLLAGSAAAGPHLFRLARPAAAACPSMVSA